MTASAGLALSTYALIESRPGRRRGRASRFSLLFVVVEARAPAPMLPLALFRNRQFSGANLTTLAVYAALSGAFFLLVLQLQVALGYSALEAGMAAAAGHPAHGQPLVARRRVGAARSARGSR